MFFFLFQEAKSKVEEGYRLPSPSGTPPDIYKLMTRCWAENDQDRPSFQDIVTQLKAVKR